MEKSFFFLSDLLQRYRRNLLFVAVLCIINFHEAIDTDDLKILGVTPPKELLSIGLIFCLCWFFCNYAFHLYAELFQWKIDKIKYTVQDNRTLSMAIKQTGPDAYFLIANIIEHQALGQDTSQGPVPEAQIRHVEAVIKNGKNDLQTLIRNDEERFKKFNNVVNEFQLATRIRFWTLDVSIPTIVTAYALATALRIF